jgi:hypothetical protein
MGRRCAIMRGIPAMKTVLFSLIAGIALAVSPSAAPGQVVISEFMASNRSTLADEDAAFEDWIEIHNTGAAPVNLLNWSLTDSAAQPARWRFPATNLTAGARLVVFASGKDRRIPGRELHTDFRLSAGGEYLALVEPDGVTIASEFAPVFPPQVSDVSYGVDSGQRLENFLPTNAVGRLLVPAGGADGTNWVLPGFDDSGWLGATGGVGYVAGSIADQRLTNTLAGYWKFDETNGLLAADASGLNNHGALRNFPANNTQWVAGRVGGALRFRGSPLTDYVFVTNYPKSTTTLTVSAWVWADARPVWASVAKNWPGGNASHFHLGLTDTAGDLSNYIRQNNADYGLRENVLFPIGSWQHVAFTLDATTERLYRNGALVASAPYSGSVPAPTFAPLAIGAKVYNGGASVDSFWQGKIDELAVWNRALSAAEIAGLASPGGAFAGLVKTDARAAMFRRNATCYLRFPFTVDDPALYTRWILRLQYNDGFVAWLNGQEIARRNAPDPLDWNSAATNRQSAAASGEFESFRLAEFENLIVPGTNVLAIQALNAAADDVDFFIAPALDALSTVSVTNALTYFTAPTPGGENVPGVAVLGPIIGNVAHTPLAPLDHEDLLVTARVAPAFAAVTNVTLRYRVMYSNEVTMPMFDDGAHGDGAAGDGVFGASIPASASTNGQMIRYRIGATDALSRVSRAPLFNDLLDSDEYFGTVVHNPAISTPLPVFHWFLATPGAAETDTGTRCSLFYNGEFYDNIYVRIRGGTARAWPKKSYKVEFNEDHEFLLRPGERRVTEFDWNATYTDKAYVRAVLTSEHQAAVGLPTPEIFHMQIRQNTAFYSVALYTENVDRDFLIRTGMDENGALYKGGPGSTGDTVSSFEKKTRRAEGNGDLQAFLSGLALTGAALENFVFDNVDVPEVINYMATMAVTQDIDGTDKNHFLHRDTLGSREWRLLPWDLDLTFGPDALNTDNMFFQLQNVAGPACASHPFIGARPYLLHAGKYQRLIEAMVNTPRTRAMILRRTRTLTEQFLTTGWFQNRIEQLYPLLLADVTADRARWGASAHFAGTTYTLRAALDRIKNEYLTPRPGYLLGTNIVGVGLSNALKQPFNVRLDVAGVEFNPASGIQAQEYLCLSNPTPFALDVSGWRMTGGIDHTFDPGTVIPSNSVLYLSPDVAAFRARPTGPRGGQGLFAQGNYQGRLSARGETLRVLDSFGQIVSTHTYLGAPSLAQQFLRVTELMYHPAALAGDTNGAEEFEYVEVTNISTNQSVSVSGIRFVGGIEFDFTSAGGSSIAPGQRVLVVKNGLAFASRYGWNLPLVAGEYTGSLENGGERIRLVDAAGEEILDFEYNNAWHPITDGHGFSLVVLDELAEPDAWSRRSQWRASGRLLGSPSQDDPPPPAIASVVINEALTRTDAPPPTDSIELHNPSGVAADIGGWFLSDDFNAPKKYRIASGASLAPGGFITFDESQFNTGPAAFALSSDGDEVWLFSADAAGNLTGYFHGHRFGAAEDGASFGRHLTSTGEEHFVAQAARTLGAANTGPKVGPIVVSEIFYRPPDLAEGGDNSADEFIEIRNLSASAVPLYDPALPANTWRVSGGIEFVFPQNQTIAAGAYALLVNFNPATNAAALAAFRTAYTVDAAVPLFGPYGGKLDNSADVVSVEKPAPPVAGKVPYVLVDQVAYRDGAPWPAAADGTGASLQRAVETVYGNDPVNWIAALPTPGGPRAAGGNPPSILSQPAGRTAIASSSVTLMVGANGTVPLRYQWRRNGVVLFGATNALLTLSNVQGSDDGDYSVVINNAAGSTVSSNATLSILYGATVLAQPQNVNLRGSTNAADYGSTTNRSATFTVAGYSLSPIIYQWRFNGAPIPGATNPVLTVGNVTLAQDGLYDAVLTDAIGSLTSQPARLTVLLSPVILQPPLNQTVVEGSDFTVSVEVTGNPLPMAYSWRRSSIVVATNSGDYRSNFVTLNTAAIGLVLTNNMLSSNYQMRLVVYNAANNSPGALALFTNTVLADFDRDGIPDVVENELGLSPNNAADAALDADGDGQSNRAEFVAGTEPTNAASFLKIEQAITPGAAVVKVAAVSNRTYTVQFNDHLGPVAWRRLADLVARPSNRIELITDPAWTTNRYYRLVLPVQP